MSGVIDKDGVQWERCNRCAGFTQFDDLLYEQPSDEFPYGRDLCQPCDEQLAQGGPVKLRDDQLLDQLSPKRKAEIAAQVRAQIAEHGLQVFVHNADGTVTDESIPPRGGVR